VLNLIKVNWPTAPISITLLMSYSHASVLPGVKAFYRVSNAIKYLNQSLPTDKKILYEAFDMSRASKT